LPSTDFSSGRSWTLQRLFSSFPGGWPGIGLLLLRAAVGISLIIQGAVCLAGWEPGVWSWAVGLPALIIGAALLIGFMTPVAGALAAVGTAGVALSWLSPSIPDVFGGAPATVFMVVMATTVLLVGPGAFSLDARWFGRREVVIPPLGS
jgi:uncharacterized membrane protein YphA (DoxX/SURF4 family)